VGELTDALLALLAIAAPLLLAGWLLGRPPPRRDPPRSRPDGEHPGRDNIGP